MARAKTGARVRNGKPTSGKSAPSRAPQERHYTSFDQLDGRHAFKEAVPLGYVDYPVRVRKGAKLAYFNYDLAKEMGLIPKNHPHKMNPALRKKLIETFAIQIVNEYDILHGSYHPRDLKPHRYMATRYLQLQHPNSKGLTSGDGRGIWNGEFKDKDGTVWDVSSSGTGATCLSPATAMEKKFFQTGDPKVCYGCGYNETEDGLYATIMSEILNQTGIRTERTLAIVEFEKGYSVNVRAAKSLIRPSHFFYHLKLSDFDGLKRSIDFFIDRQTRNGDWKKRRSDKERYDYLLEETCRNFAEAAARFEANYVFVWMDWDGDNILADGGIIDYGSVRQFGLFHHEYRYDDEERWSTNIPEQKQKARYIVQTFAQIHDFLTTGKKKNLRAFAKHPILKEFDKHFEKTMQTYILYRMGFSWEQAGFLVKKKKNLVLEYQKLQNYFERAKARRGKYKVADGITCDAIYSMRDILRELPRIFLSGMSLVPSKRFIDIAKSSYASKKDVVLTGTLERSIRQYQKIYLELVDAVAKKESCGKKRVLLEMNMRSSVINRYERVTGDGVLHVVERLLRDRSQITIDKFHQIIEDFIEYQVLIPDRKAKRRVQIEEKPRSRTSRTLKRVVDIIKEYREGF